MSKKHQDADVAFIEALAELVSAKDLAEVQVKRDYDDNTSLNVRVTRTLAAPPAPIVSAAAAPAAPAPVAVASPAAAAEPAAAAQGKGGFPLWLLPLLAIPLLGALLWWLLKGFGGAALTAAPVAAAAAGAAAAAIAVFLGGFFYVRHRRRKGENIALSAE